MFIEQIFSILTNVLLALFLVYFLWQFRFIFAAITKKFSEPKSKFQAKYCFVICAKDEEAVIARAIESILSQNYPKDLYDILVVADNCNDNTVEICKSYGITNILQKNDSLVGKGHALDFGFKYLIEQTNTNSVSKATNDNIEFDAVIILDADNVLNDDYLYHMNNSFSNGQKIIAPFRNTKSFSQSIVAAANALWFLRDSVLNNRGHFLTNNQCTVSGTGFLISKDIILSLGGFPFTTLMEDFEFSAYCCYKNIRISYNNNASVYDFATGSIKNFSKQHSRWLSGFVDVTVKTVVNIIKGIFRKTSRKYCIDYSLRIFVIALIIIFEIFVLFFTVILSVVFLNDASYIWYKEVLFIILSLFLVVIMLYTFMIFTIVNNWKKIDAPPKWKILAVLCYPFSQLFNIPLFFKSLFSKRKWKHIER